MPSAINPDVITAAPVNKADIRAQFAAARDEITVLQAGQLSSENVRGNRFANQCFRIDQQGHAAGITPSSAGAAVYVVDEWAASRVGGPVFSVSRSYNSPNAQGFRLVANVTTFASSFAATDRAMPFLATIEGQTVVDLAWGTANAKPITISFEFAATVNGTYCIVLRNGALNRSRVETFPYTGAGAIQQIARTIPGDTGGTWSRDNAVGIFVDIAALSGSTFHAPTTGLWSTGNFISAVTATNWGATTDNNVIISAPKFEVGTVKTAFELRPLTQELDICQRYLCRMSHHLQAPAAGFMLYGFTFPQMMRVIPTAAVINAGSLTSASVVTDFGTGSATGGFFQIDATAASGSVLGRIVQYNARML